MRVTRIDDAIIKLIIYSIIGDQRHYFDLFNRINYKLLTKYNLKSYNVIIRKHFLFSKLMKLSL